MVASAWGRIATATKEGLASTSTTRDHHEGETAIFSDSSLKVNEINVETFKGVVQLSGFVWSRRTSIQAQAARGVAGVKSVKNDMRIK
jgi:hyperosmotically inducible protein